MAQCHQSHTIENILIKDKHWHKNSEYISMKKKNFYDHLMMKNHTVMSNLPIQQQRI